MCATGSLVAGSIFGRVSGGQSPLRGGDTPAGTVWLASASRHASLTDDRAERPPSGGNLGDARTFAAQGHGRRVSVATRELCMDVGYVDDGDY